MRGSVLVVGLGEVGKPLYGILSEAFEEVYGYDSDSSKTVNTLDEVSRPVDFLHVAFPFKNRELFVRSVLEYVDIFSPGVVVVHSSVAPGTTRVIQSRTDADVVYSPVRGKHPHLRDHLLFWPKWVSGVRRGAVERAKEHLERAGFRVRVASDPESLELAKLWETVYRAVMIASWQEVHRIARRAGADIGIVAEFVSEVHEVLRDRPIYYPDVIGGHCLIPNTEILLSEFDSDLLRFVLKSNRMRGEELKDAEVSEEVRRVKEIWARQAPKDYYRID